MKLTVDPARMTDHFPHRFWAASRAISVRRFLLSFAALAAPPLRPSATAALSFPSSVVPRSSSISPRGDLGDLDGRADYVGRALLSFGSFRHAGS